MLRALLTQQVACLRTLSGLQDYDHAMLCVFLLTQQVACLLIVGELHYNLFIVAVPLTQLALNSTGSSPRVATP